MDVKKSPRNWWQILRIRKISLWLSISSESNFLNSKSTLKSIFVEIVSDNTRVSKFGKNLRTSTFSISVVYD